MKASETGQFRSGKDALRCRFKFIDLLDVVERKSDIKDPRRKSIIQDYDALRNYVQGKGFVEMSVGHQDSQ